MKQKWWILLAMSCSISMIFIDITVLPVALPTIQRELALSELALQWLINAYTLALTLFVLAGGRLGDRYGPRKIVFYGLIFFTIGSVLCGMSNNETWFITSRVIQGVGGAFLIPAASMIVFISFPPAERGKALGFYVSIGAIFFAMGPFIGGLLAQYATWRLIFWINVPIAILGAIMTKAVVPHIEGKKRRLDLFGFFTFSIGIGAIVIALMQVKAWGWTSPITLSLLIGGVVMVTLLLIFDRNVHDPYIRLSLFANRNFSGSVFGVFMTQFLAVVTVFWAMYFQNVYGFSPSKAGLISLIANSPIIIAPPIGGHLLDKYGPRLPVTIGFLLIACSLFWFLQNLENDNLVILLTALIPFGFGFPFILTPSFTTALSEVTPENRGLASGTITMCRQLGGTLGLTILGSLFLTVQMNEFSGDLAKNTETMSLVPRAFEGLLAGEPRAVDTLQALPSQTQPFVKQSFYNAYVAGFKAINTLSMLAALVGLAVFHIFVRKKSQPKI